MKTKLDYTVRTTRAPGETTDTWTPMIVDRLQPTGLEAVIEKCIDRASNRTSITRIPSSITPRLSSTTTKISLAAF